MVVSVWAGSKRTCPPSDLAEGDGAKSNCISSKGIHNFAYPRTGNYPHSPAIPFFLFAIAIPFNFPRHASISLYPTFRGRPPNPQIPSSSSPFCQKTGPKLLWAGKNDSLQASILVSQDFLNQANRLKKLSVVKSGKKVVLKSGRSIIILLKYPSHVIHPFCYVALSLAPSVSFPPYFPSLSFLLLPFPYCPPSYSSSLIS